MGADDDHLMETAGREPNGVVGLDDTPGLASLPSRRYSCDVHLPVTRIRRPVRLDGNAPRRIPRTAGGATAVTPDPSPRARGPRQWSALLIVHPVRDLGGQIPGANSATFNRRLRARSLRDTGTVVRGHIGRVCAAPSPAAIALALEPGHADPSELHDAVLIPDRRGLVGVEPDPNGGDLFVDSLAGDYDRTFGRFKYQRRA